MRGTLNFPPGMRIAVLNAMPSPDARTDETLRGAASKPASKNRRKLWGVLGFVSLLGIAATMWLPKLWVCTRPPNAPAGTDAAVLAAAAEAFIIGHGSETCPTADEMKRDGFLSSRANTEDPWGTPYRIVCEAEYVVAVSAGPDLVFDTEDDIGSGQP